MQSTLMLPNGHQPDVTLHFVVFLLRKSLLYRRSFAQDAKQFSFVAQYVLSPCLFLQYVCILKNQIRGVVSSLEDD